MRASAIMLRAELPVQRNSTLYGLSATSRVPLWQTRKGFAHTNSRDGTQGPKLRALPERVARGAPIDHGIPQAQKEIPRSLCQEEQLLSPLAASVLFESSDESLANAEFAVLRGHSQ